MTTDDGSRIGPTMRLIALGAWGVAAVWVVMSLTYPFGWDQGLFAWVGGVIVQGGLPYRDAWDFKGPLVYYVYALAQALFGIHLWSIRILDALLLMAATRAIWQAASALTDGATAGWTALIFVLWYASHSFWHTAQPDGWAAMLLIISLGPLFRSPGAAGTGQLIATGLAIGSATLYKPLYAAFVLLPVLHVLLTTRRGRIAAVAAIAGGWLLPIVTTAAWFAAHDSLGELVAVHLRYAAAYVSLSPENPLRGLVEYLLSSRVIAVALPLVLYGGVVLWRTERRPATILLTTWSALVVAFVVFQNRFYAYHWLPILPAAALLGAVGLHVLAQRQRTLAGIICTVILTHALAPVVLEEVRFAAWRAGLIDRSAYYDGYGEPGDDRRAVWWLRERGPGPVFIFGWHSSVAWLSERPTVSRFGYSLPLMMGEGLPRRSQYRAEALAALAARPPRYIITGTQSEQIMGERLGVADFPELAELIERSYRPAAHLGRITIHEHVH